MFQPDRLIDWGRRRGLEIEYVSLYESRRRQVIQRNKPLLGALYQLAMKVGGVLLRRRLSETDFFLVLRRPATA